MCGGASDLRGEAGEPLCAPCWDDVQDAHEFYAARDIGYRNAASAASDREARGVVPLELADAARRLGLLAVVCMDCTRHYNTVSAQGAEGGLSHGLCAECSAQREADVPTSLDAEIWGDK